MSQIIVEMTPVVFEDGNIYYFQVLKRESSNDYHDLFVYRKIDIDKSSFFDKLFKKVNIVSEFEQINDRPELISISLNVREIKSDIIKIINSTKANKQIEGWDGFVGDVPEHLKQALKREAKLKDILSD
jgi:hypothetical protein